MCLYNMASSGKFSTDYANEIWGYPFIHYHRRHRHAAEPAQPAGAGGEEAQEVMISSSSTCKAQQFILSPPDYSCASTLIFTSDRLILSSLFTCGFIDSIS